MPLDVAKDGRHTGQLWELLMHSNRHSAAECMRAINLLTMSAKLELKFEYRRRVSEGTLFGSADMNKHLAHALEHLQDDGTFYVA